MNFTMAGRAVPESRRSQIMEGGGRTCQGAWSSGMAFQAELLHLVATQHLWIDRSVRLMAALATVDLKRRMFKNEWPVLVRMAGDAALLAADGRPL